MAGRLQTELARRAQIEQPGGQHALVDNRAAVVGNPLGVEWLRALATRPVWVFGDRDRLGKDPLPELVAQKAGAAGDRWAGDRTQQMRDEAARDPRVEHHRAAAGRHLAGAEPADRPLGGALADLGRVAQIVGIDRVGKVVIAFHAVTRAADHRDADAVMRAGIPAGKPVRAGNRDPRAAPARFGAFRIGDPLDGKRGLLGRARPLDQCFRARLDRVEHVERRPVMGNLRGVGEAAERVFGHRAGHRQGAFDQLGQHFRRAIAGRHDRLALADQDAQPEILALRAFELLGLAEPAGMRQRGALKQHRIGGVGPGLAGATHHILQQVDVVRRVLVYFFVCHFSS